MTQVNPRIKRIKELSNIGTFSAYKGADIDFHKLTLIYGFNTFGKTTLCDIFQSLSDNDSNIISSRKTIPENDSKQIVKLGIHIEDSRESEIKFEGGSWNQKVLSLEVFGSDFIHKNLFTGLTIEHENKKNFTDFILGEEGNKLGKQLEKKRKLKKEYKGRLENLIPPYVKNKNDIEVKKFLDLDIKDENIESINKNITDIQVTLKKDKELVKNIAQIVDRKSPNILNIPKISILEDLQKIKDELCKSYKNIGKDSKESFLKHIGDTFKQDNKDQAENWIKQGLQCSKDLESSNCLFCGQELSKAKLLIETYQSYFDEAYKKFISAINSNLTLNLKDIESVSFNVANSLTTTLSILKDYQDLFNDEDKQKLKNFETVKTTIEDEEKSLKDIKTKILEEIKKLVEAKKREPYKNIDDFIYYEDLGDDLKQYLEEIDKAKVSIDYFISRVNELKKPYQENTKQEEIKKLESQLKELELKKGRIEEDQYCIDYSKCKTDIVALEEDEKQLNTKIINEQSDYLGKYFDEVNKLFKKFGSKDFILEKQDGSANAHKKVYSLLVKYKNSKIDNSNLSKVFSESDKRALALAIFFAKIQLKPEEDRKKTVIILDDPITSFDDNRITHTINATTEILKNINQIIILTHYIHYIKRFYEVCSNYDSVKLCQLERNSETSFIVECSQDEFCLNDLSKAFFEIYGFIKRDVREITENKLRKYLENYLRFYFIKQIKDNDLKQNYSLEKFLLSLVNNQIINQLHFDKLEEFRKTLNPESHIYTSNNSEDIRSTAEEIVGFLHSELCLKQGNIN